MKVLLSTRGSRGDVHPVVAIADGLAARGHSTTLRLPATFVDHAARRGLRARGHSEDSHRVMRRFGRDWDGLRTELEWFARSLDEQFDYLLAESSDADVMVAATSELAAASVAEYRRIPYVRLAFAPWMTSYQSNALLPWQGLPPIANRVGWSLVNAAVDLLAFRTMRRWRAALGLPLVVGSGDHIARHGLSLLAMSETLSPPCPSWRGRYRYEYGGYCFDPSDGLLPDAVRHFVEAGPPPVYVGLGSVNVADPVRFTELVRDAALRAGCRVVLGAGWTGLGAGLATRYLLPVGELDHHALFPRMAGVVHHGGSGTTHTAARAGVPQLILPQLADQHYWGHRVHALGLGPRPIGARRLDVAKLTRALDELAHQPRYALEAARVGRLVQRERGVEAAVQIIERAVGVEPATPVEPRAVAVR